MLGLFKFFVGCCLFLSALGVGATRSTIFCDREKNEVYCDCINPCNTCEERGQCSREVHHCVPGCDCIPGFYRNWMGRCVPEYLCDGKCKPDEVYLPCGSSCPDTCDNYGRPRNCTLECVAGCFCKPGLVRATNRRCIIPEMCGKVICNADEEFQLCGTSCPDTCHNYGIDRSCTLQCVRGCFCKRGLVRRNDFKCVIPEKCNKRKCNRDEVFKTCGTACPKTCENYWREIPCTKDCVRGCFCAGNTVRNVDTKKCVPRDQCPKRCGFFERYTTCVNPCNDCVDRGNCAFLVCNEGCDCIKGFYREYLPNGPCIPASQCPGNIPICKRDEQYYQCRPCNKSCETYNKPFGCPAVCTPGCDCKYGLVRRWDGKCVKPNQCFIPIPTCKPDEQYYRCRPCNKACDNKPVYCATVCTPGCDCKVGLLRRWDGRCVKPNQCNKPGPCGKNEEFSACYGHCSARCDNLNPICDKSRCIPGCICKKCFAKNKRDVCIPVKQCPQKNGQGKFC